jgi:hypothetical protein
MYLLPAIKIAAEDGAARANVFLLEREMPDFKTWDEFEEMNSPDKIRPAWQWIEKAVPRRLNGIRSSPDSSESVVFDIALFARPKAALPNTLHPSVKDAVRSLDLSRSKQLLRNLGNLTDRAFHLLKKELPDLLGKAEFAKGDKESLMKLWWELGRLLTCYHFTMSAMQRTDPLSDKFVIEVTQRTNVVGAKTTGPGLGGTVLVLYFAERGKEQEVLDEVQATADRYGYTNLSGSILKAFCAS